MRRRTPTSTRPSRPGPWSFRPRRSHMSSSSAQAGRPRVRPCRRRYRPRGHSPRADQVLADGEVAARAPAGKLAALVDWLEAECRRSGVRIETGHEVTLEEVDGHEGPVVHCTGSRPGRRNFELATGASVATAAEVLSAERQIAEPPPSPVVVWDRSAVRSVSGRGAASRPTAPWSARHADHVVACNWLARVTSVRRTPPATTRSRDRATQHDVRVDPRSVTVENRYSGERRVIERCSASTLASFFPRTASGARRVDASRVQVTRSPHGRSTRRCSKAPGRASLGVGDGDTARSLPDD